jgi:hypothetical protein
MNTAIDYNRLMLLVLPILFSLQQQYDTLNSCIELLCWCIGCSCCLNNNLDKYNGNKLTNYDY